MNKLKNIGKVYVASPLNAPTKKEISHNMKKAKEYCYLIEKLSDGKAWAIHAHLPNLLDDNNEEEREIALRWGIELLGYSDTLIVCGTKITKGMENEIKEARKQNKNIYYFYRNVSRFHILNVISSKIFKFRISIEEELNEKGGDIPCINFE